MHKKCYRYNLGCIKCCESTIPGFNVTHFELHNDYSGLNSLFFNPYDRSQTINQIGNTLGENFQSSNNEYWNEISQVLATCRYQEPRNIKSSKHDELSVLSLNIRSLYKNLTCIREQYETILNCDILCFNETNCTEEKLPNGLDDLKLEGFHEPIIQAPARKSGRGGGLAVYINKRVSDSEKIELFQVNSVDPEDTNGEMLSDDARP